MMCLSQYKNESISHGTMRLEDLIPTFADLLEDAGCVHSELDEIRSRMLTEGYYDQTSSEADYDLEWLFNKLDELAPPGFCFGAHPGDGSDYGFWEAEDYS